MQSEAHIQDAQGHSQHCGLGRWGVQFQTHQWDVWPRTYTVGQREWSALWDLQEPASGEAGVFMSMSLQLI